MDVLIASPMTPEDAERVAAVEGIELTYRPELLPTRKWVGDINGEGGVPLDDERWEDAVSGQPADRPPRPPRPVLMRYELKPVRPFAAAYAPR